MNSSGGDSEPIGPMDFFPWHQADVQQQPAPELEPFDPLSADQDDIARRILSLSTRG